MASPVSPVREQLKLRREAGRRLFHKIGVIQMAQGGVAVILGIVTLVYGIPNGSFYYYMGTPLWTGLLLLVGGFLGIKAGAERDGPGDVVTSTQKAYVVGNYTITIITLTPAIFIVTYSAIVLNWCLPPWDTDDDLDCTHFRSENFTIAVIDLVAGVVITLCTIPPMIFYCLYGRAFGLRVNNMSTEADPIVTEQIHYQADIIRQQQEEIQRLAQRQNAMEKQLSSAHSDLGAPPPYDEPIPYASEDKTGS